MSHARDHRYQIPEGAEGALAERARALARAEKDEDHAVGEEVFLTFRAGTVLYALPLTAVDRSVNRLGEVAPVPGAPAIVQGVCFVEATPYLVLDLVERITGQARPAVDLGNGPALLVRREGRSLAVAVQAPLELLEARLTLRAAQEETLGGVGITGRMESGTLALSETWFRAYLRELEVGR